MLSSLKIQTDPLFPCHGVIYELLANSINPDQTAPKEQSDQGLYYLLTHLCVNIHG